MAEIAGLKLIVPSSVAGSGVSVSASGKVSFTAATSVSVNGCFTSTYDNYLIVVRYVGSVNNSNGRMRLRAAGSDNSTANSYVAQALEASSTTVGAARNTENNAVWNSLDDSQRSGTHLYMYGPFLAQPTAVRAVTVGGLGDAVVRDDAFTHNQSTSYDGFTMYPNSGNFTGALTVYGLSQ